MYFDQEKDIDQVSLIAWHASLGSENRPMRALDILHIDDEVFGEGNTFRPI